MLKGSRRCCACRCRRLTQSARAGQGRPADADPRQDSRPRGPGRVRSRAPARLPAASRSSHTYLRNYENRALAAQVLGYVGEISDGGAGARSSRRATAAATRSARPASRRRSTAISAGRPAPPSSASTRWGVRSGARSTERGPAQPGNNVRLTLDIGLQRAAERALRDGIETRARERGVQRERRRDRRARPARRSGARDGVEPDLQAVRLRRPCRPEEARAAHRRRGREGATTIPGSTARPPSLPAGLDVQAAHRAGGDLRTACSRRYDYDPVHPVSPSTACGKVRIQELEPVHEPPMTLTTALAQSCDTYFYDLGNRYYERRRHERPYWRRSRPGRSSSGSASRPASTSAARRRACCRRRPGGSATYKTRLGSTAWNPGDSIQLAIGQKDITVTPLQLARFYAMLANGGKLVTPYVVSSIEQPGNDGSPPSAATRSRRARRADRRRPGGLDVVRDGLYHATHGGDGHLIGVFGSFPVPIAGKTGTAEKVVNAARLPAVISRISRGGAAGGRSRVPLLRDGERRRSSSAP